MKNLTWRSSVMINVKVILRYSKNHIYDLKETLIIPGEIMCYNNVRIDGVEVLCAVLKRCAYTCRFIGMV